MNTVMFSAFITELNKIAENIALPSTFGNSTNSSIKPKSPMKVENKDTSYTAINTQVPEANFDAATGAKSAPPPPVRT